MSRRRIPSPDKQDSSSDRDSDNSDKNSDHSNSPIEHVEIINRSPSRRSRSDGYYESYRRRSRSPVPLRGRFAEERHNVRKVYAISESDESDNGFDFVLPRISASNFSQDTILADFETKEATVEYATVSAPTSYGMPPEASYNMLQAQYTGEGVIGGEHLASLTAVKDLKKNPYSIYRWVHFCDPAMRFSEFRKAVVSLPGLMDSERTGIAKLLNHVREKFDKPYRASNSVNTRVMLPGVLQEEAPSTTGTNDRKSSLQTMTWMCLPYFSLDKYSDNVSALGEGAYPTRTLIQARYALVDRKRDMQQAVCNLADSETGFCFHIPQVWYIVIGASLLITCSALPMSTLRGDNIPLSILSSPEPYKDEARKLLISFGTSVLWSFRLDECETWFALMSKFSEFPLHFRFMYRSKVVTAKLWPRIVNQAKHSPGNLSITFDLKARRPPQVRGILRRRPYVSITGSSNMKEPQDDGCDDQVQQLNLGMKYSARNETISTSSNDDFFVLTWLHLDDSTTSMTSAGINSTRLVDDLKAVDEFLQDETNLVQSLAYKECTTTPHATVLDHLRREGSSVSASNTKGSATSKSRERDKYATKVDIFNAAESVFEFFMPVSTDGPSVDKYWGALYTTLDFSTEDKTAEGRSRTKTKATRSKVDNFDDFERIDLRDELEEIVRQMQPLKDLLSQAPLPDRTKIKIPDELVKIWLHVLMMLIFAAREKDTWRAQSRKVYKLFVEGSKIMLQGLITRSLVKSSVVMPQEIASLVSLKLLEGRSSGTVKRSITQTYLDYLSKLELDIEAKPLDREHQDKLVRLQEEIAVITRHLGSQRLIFQAIRMSAEQSTNTNPSGRLYEETRRKEGEVRERERKAAFDFEKTQEQRMLTSRIVSYAPQQRSFLRPAAYDDDGGGDGGVNFEELTKLAPTDEGGYRALLLQDCITVIERNLRDFEEMRIKTEELKTFNIRRIDKNKDRHDNAIYAFTVVTIIFLPLSTVASILGMNTNDVRNMEVNQWVFWVVAIPLLLIVLLLCLIWTDELGNFLIGFKNLWRKDSSVRIETRDDDRNTSYAARQRNRYYEEYDSDREERIARRDESPRHLSRRQRTVFV